MPTVPLTTRTLVVFKSWLIFLHPRVSRILQVIERKLDSMNRSTIEKKKKHAQGPDAHS